MAYQTRELDLDMVKQVAMFKGRVNPLTWKRMYPEKEEEAEKGKVTMRKDETFFERIGLRYFRKKEDKEREALEVYLRRRYKIGGSRVKMGIAVLSGIRGVNKKIEEELGEIE